MAETTTATPISTGRRKEAVARVRLAPGAGTIIINHRAFENYFPREALRLSIKAPLLLTHQLGKYDVAANVDGGGLTGQAGAGRSNSPAPCPTAVCSRVVSNSS